jgi:hypothetical protein
MILKVNLRKSVVFQVVGQIKTIPVLLNIHRREKTGKFQKNFISQFVIKMQRYKSNEAYSCFRIYLS